jgi:hypothetical protein
LPISVIPASRQTPSHTRDGAIRFFDRFTGIPFLDSAAQEAGITRYLQMMVSPGCSIIFPLGFFPFR